MTILVPIYNGIRARNFFRTDVYRELVRDPGLRLIVVIPSAKRDFYRREFPEPNVIFEAHDNLFESRFGEVLATAALNLLHTATVRYKQKLAYLRFRPKYQKQGRGWELWLRFALKRLAHHVLGRLALTRSLVRFLDRFVPLDPRVVELLEAYRPDLVLVPDIVFMHDRVFLRAAKRRGFCVVGLVRSWDNLTSKGVIQILPDKLIVHTSIMKREAIRYAGVPERDVIVTGPPEFDRYARPLTTTREGFFRALGIPGERRLILCAPFFDLYNGSAVAIINALTAAIDDGRLPPDAHLLVRYRPASSEIPPGALQPSGHLTISRPCSHYFKDNVTSPFTFGGDWEFSQADVDLLVNSLYFSDVTINTVSTLSIDAAALDKPVINIRFDADPACPPEHSVHLVAQHDHYVSLEKTGGIWLARSIEDLIAAVNAYLGDGRLHAEGRERMRKEQIEFLDGGAGRRIAETIKELARSKRA